MLYLLDGCGLVDRMYMHRYRKPRIDLEDISKHLVRKFRGRDRHEAHRPVGRSHLKDPVLLKRK